MPKKRPKLTNKLRNRIKLRRLIKCQNGCCIQCGDLLHFKDPVTGHIYQPGHPSRVTFDHVKPRSSRPGLEPNRLASHRYCNQKKGARPPNGCELLWLDVVNTRLKLAA